MPASAQPMPTVQPAVIEQPAASAAPLPAAPREAQLPAGTDVLLRLNDLLSSRTHRVGDTFPLTVVRDVAVDGHVLIPAGTRAVGQVTWRTGRGGFGKAGKMEITLRYIELNGRRIPITGFHRQEGEGNTAGTIGAMLGAGVIGGMMVRGRSATIPEGREFTARTADAIPVLVPAEQSAAATIAASYTPSPVGTEIGRRRDARPTARSCVSRAQRQAPGAPRRQAEIERQCRASAG